LVAEANADPECRRLLPRVLGVSDADDDEVAALVARMVACGARARVEARLAALAKQASAALVEIDLNGAAVMRGAIAALVERER
jgi:hypothetical protein